MIGQNFKLASEIDNAPNTVGLYWLNCKHIVSVWDSYK